MLAVSEQFAKCSMLQEWPDRLRLSVLRVLSAGEDQEREWFSREFDVHHVVAAGLDGARQGRLVMSRWGVSIHNAVNAAIVPRSFHQGQGLHRHAFLEAVNQQLMSAEVFAERVALEAGFPTGRLIIVKTIQKMGIELVLRSGDPVALELQRSLQERPTLAGKRLGRVTAERRARMARRAGAALAGADRASPSRVGADRDDEAVLTTRGSRFPLAAACGRCDLAGAGGRSGCGTVAGAEIGAFSQ